MLDAEGRTRGDEEVVVSDTDGAFALERPALVCRWRLSHKAVPLLNRHIRALAGRRLAGAPVSMNLVAWVKQHIEWAVAEDAYHDHDGVLMIVVDEAGQAAMSVGSYEPLVDTAPAALAARAADAWREARATGVAPEVLAAVVDDVLVVAAQEGEPAAGVRSFVEQVAATRGLGVRAVMPAADDPCAEDLLKALGGDAVMLLSDEHGVVPSNTCLDIPCAETVRFLEDCYRRLIA